MCFHVRLFSLGRTKVGVVKLAVPAMTPLLFLDRLTSLPLKRSVSQPGGAPPTTSMVVVALMSPVKARVLPLTDAVRSK